jgi:hypothetical protein
MSATAQLSRAARRAAQAQSPKKAAVDPRVDARLRRLTARVLDELKAPGTIPSVAILAALHEAREG